MSETNWIFDVLADLVEFTRLHGLVETQQNLERALVVAGREFATGKAPEQSIETKIALTLEKYELDQ